MSVTVSEMTDSFSLGDAPVVPEGRTAPHSNLARQTSWLEPYSRAQKASHPLAISLEPTFSCCQSNFPSTLKSQSFKDFASVKMKVSFFPSIYRSVGFCPQKEIEKGFCCGCSTTDNDHLLLAASWMQTAPGDKKWKQESHFLNGFPQGKTQDIQE